jgi:two-component system, sensor histidine kinase and response regulator
MDLRAIEGEGINTHFEPLDIDKLIKQVIREHFPLAKRKNINIAYKSQPVSVITDKLSCLRIFDQLFSNAIKFSPADSTISVDIVDTEDDVLIRIVDSGFGIAEVEQANLYKKFTVLSNRSSGGESATGIGLFIAQWMAKNIGGKIVYDNDGKSQFTLHIPKVRMT